MFATSPAAKRAPRLAPKTIGGKPLAARIFEVAMYVAMACFTIAMLVLWPRVLRVQHHDHGGHSSTSEYRVTEEVDPGDSHHGRMDPSKWTLTTGAEDGGSGVGGSRAVKYLRNVKPIPGITAEDFCPAYRPFACGEDVPIFQSVPIGDATTSANCSWAAVTYRSMPSDRKLQICTYNPAVDKQMSRALHETGKSTSELEWEALKALGPCSPKKPFVIEVGASLGLTPLMMAELGCHVIAFEPVAESAARIAASFARNGFGADRLTLLQNAVLAHNCPVAMYWNVENPAAARVTDVGSSSPTSIPAVSLASFFKWAGRPKHPKTGRPIKPSDVALVRVATEGYDLAVLHSLADAFADGDIPLVALQFYSGLSSNDAGCNARAFLDSMYTWGYRMYLNRDQWTLKRWHDFLEKESWSTIPLLIHASKAEGGLPIGFADFDSKLDV